MMHPRSFEDQVLAYLDGDLDRQSADDLLHMIDADPEKQRLLATHEKLREMLKTSHSDLTPADSAQIQLALRLPILQRLIRVESTGSEGELVAPTFLSWKSVISAFDISMMVLAILGLALALSSSSPLARVPFLHVHSDPSFKAERVASIRSQLHELLDTHSEAEHVAPNLHGKHLVIPDVPMLQVQSINFVTRDDSKVDEPTHPPELSTVTAVLPRAVAAQFELQSSFVRFEPTVRDSFEFKAHLSIYAGMNTVSRFYGSIDAVHAASTLADGELVGVSYELAPQVETGIEITRLDVPRLRYDIAADTLPTAKTPYVSNGVIEPVSAFSPRAYVSVSVARSLGFDFHLVFEGGVALLDRPSAIAGLGFQGRCSISDAVSFFGKVMLDASYVKSIGLSPVTYDGAVVDRTKEQPTLLTPGVLAGFGVQYYLF